MLDLVKLTLILLTVLWCFIGELDLVKVPKVGKELT